MEALIAWLVNLIMSVLLSAFGIDLDVSGLFAGLGL